MTDSHQPRVRGVHVLAGMIAFFVAVIAVNVGFAVVAVRSFPGEDVRRSYVQGLRYNEVLADRRAQAARGWRAESELIAAADDALVRIRLLDRDGAPLNGLSIAGVLRWPTDSRLDRTLAFQPAGDGVYVARVADVRAGRWRLRARAEDSAYQAIDFEAELTWRP